MLLAIETSCDDSSVALMDQKGKPIISLISSQIDLHDKFGGVVPEIACRAHLTNLPFLIRHVLNEAGVGFPQVEAIGVTYSPGLVGALLVGLTHGKTLAWLHDIPLIPVDHLEGHLLSPMLDNPDLQFPFLGLVASGGHTHLFVAKDIGNYELLGKTIDDAIGEAFDKVAKMLGFQYPGGPIVEKIAAECTSPTIPLPIPLKGKKTLNFSYSGMKTAVRNKALELEIFEKDKELIGYSEFKSWPESAKKEKIRDLMASFQDTIIHTIVLRIEEALKLTKLKTITIAGGVAANGAMRTAIGKIAEKKKARFYYPSVKNCTDNAAMIGFVAWQRWKKGLVDDTQNFTLDASSQSPLNQLQPTSYNL